MNLIISIAPIFIGILAGCAVASYIKSGQGAKDARSMLSNFDRSMRSSKRQSSYEKTALYLRKKGADVHFGEWINPSTYLILNICCAILGFILGTFGVSPLVGIVGAFVGFILPRILIDEMDKSDSKKMTDQISTLYNTLQIQISAGVELTQAMSRMYDYMPSGRLRRALERFSAEIRTHSDFESALNMIENSFDNEFIDTLCVILRQGRATGRTADLMRDISLQISDMQSAALAARKDSLDRFSTFCNIFIMAAGLGIVLWGFINMMAESIVLL